VPCIFQNADRMYPSFRQRFAAVRGSAFRLRRRGAILVAVLGFVVLLGFVLVAFIDEAVSKIKYFGVYYSRADLRVDAYSALDSTLAVLSEVYEIDGGLWAPAQGWSDPLGQSGFEASDGVRVTVDFEDESGKIPLDADTDPSILIALFTEMGFSLQEAEHLTDPLLDWMDDDDLARLHGFDGDDYDREDPPYYPPNRRIRSWDELRLIYVVQEHFFDEAGNPTPQLRQFQRAVSLYHTGQININMAPPIVLNVLQQHYGIDAMGILDFRTGGLDADPDTVAGRGLIRSDANAFGVTGDIAAYESTTLKVSVEARRGGNAFLLTAIVTYRGADPSADRDSAERESGSGSPTGTQGATARDVDAGTALGYPFWIVMLSENEKN